MAELIDVSGTLNVTTEAGATWRLRLELRNDDGAPLLLDGYGVSWWLYGPAGVVAQAPGADPLTRLDCAQNTVELEVDDEATALIEPGRYRHRFRLVDPSGKAQPFIAGRWDVEEGMTA